MERFTIRAAAERCGVSYDSLRKRVDRGSVQVVKEDGLRMIPREELERAGLWPEEGSDRVEAEIARLCSENEQLGTELRQRREALTAEGRGAPGEGDVAEPEALLAPGSAPALAGAPGADAAEVDLEVEGTPATGASPSESAAADRARVAATLPVLRTGRRRQLLVGLLLALVVYRVLARSRR
jgi:hypothetical protein